MTKLFTPSTTDLSNMIAAAMAKCDADIAHTQDQIAKQEPDMTDRKIIIRAEACDGWKARRTFKTLEAAQKYAHDRVGPHPEYGTGYAVGDGYVVVYVEGATFAEIFPEPTVPGAPRAKRFDEKGRELVWVGGDEPGEWICPPEFNWLPKECCKWDDEEGYWFPDRRLILPFHHMETGEFMEWVEVKDLTAEQAAFKAAEDRQRDEALLDDMPF